MVDNTAMLKDINQYMNKLMSEIYKDLALNSFEMGVYLNALYYIKLALRYNQKCKIIRYLYIKIYCTYRDLQNDSSGNYLYH